MNQVLGRTVAPVRASQQSRTHGDFKAADIGLHGARTNALANLLGAGERGTRTEIIEHDEEFLTAVASHKIVRTHGMEQAAGDFTQNLIPDQMAVPIIDILEMVEIAENECSANILALRTSKLATQKIHDHPAGPKRRKVSAGRL